jgi:hypothetical protein
MRRVLIQPWCYDDILIACDWLAGDSVGVIAERYSWNCNFVTSRLKRLKLFGVPWRQTLVQQPQKFFKLGDRHALLLERYRDGVKLHEIGKEFNVSLQTITNHVRKAGLTNRHRIRQNPRQRKPLVERACPNHIS